MTRHHKTRKIHAHQVATFRKFNFPNLNQKFAVCLNRDSHDYWIFLILFFLLRLNFLDEFSLNPVVISVQ